MAWLGFETRPAVLDLTDETSLPRKGNESKKGIPSYAVLARGPRASSDGSNLVMMANGHLERPSNRNREYNMDRGHVR